MYKYHVIFDLLQVRHSKDVFKDVISELTTEFSHKRKRSVQDSRITDSDLKQIIQELTNLQVNRTNNFMYLFSSVYCLFNLRKMRERERVVVLLFYVHGKHLRSCRDGQLT